MHKLFIFIIIQWFYMMRYLFFIIMMYLVQFKNTVLVEIWAKNIDRK